MITIKYSKSYPANLVSHIDTLRGVQRIFRRADIKVKYSQGFNPHMLVYFSPALSLGIESDCEYVYADTVEDELSYLEKFNKVAPKGIVGTKIFATEKSPNLAGVITWAKYRVNCIGIGKVAQSIISNDKYEIEYLEKGEKVSKDVRALILSVQNIDEDNVYFTIACGNTNLKIDRLVRFICSSNNLDYNNANIEKKEMYVGNENVDDYLTNLN